MNPSYSNQKKSTYAIENLNINETKVLYRSTDSSDPIGISDTKL